MPEGGDLRKTGGIGFQLLGASALIGQLGDMHDQIGGEVVYAVGSPVEHSVYQEFGTIHHPPQPYMRPAVGEARRNVATHLQAHPNSLDRGVRAIAEQIERDSKSFAPVDTGELRDSIDMRKVQ